MLGGLGVWVFVIVTGDPVRDLTAKKRCPDNLARTMTPGIRWFFARRYTLPALRGVGGSTSGAGGGLRVGLGVWGAPVGWGGGGGGGGGRGGAGVLRESHKGK